MSLAESAERYQEPQELTRDASPSRLGSGSSSVVAQGDGGGCGCRCGASGKTEKSSYVYALGRVHARFPSQGVEKEFVQALARKDDTAGLPDPAAYAEVLKDDSNRYLARQLCWVLTIEGLDTYLLKLRDLSDLELLLNAIRPAPEPYDLDLVIGLRGPVAPPEHCNGVMVPFVYVSQIYSFDREMLSKGIPKPQGLDDSKSGEFENTAKSVLDRILQMADNAGATDEHRALNYLAVRYPDIYAVAYNYHAKGYSLTAIDVRPSRLSGIRRILDVIFSFTDRRTPVIEQRFVRVDVTEEFPFLVTRLTEFFDR